MLKNSLHPPGVCFLPDGGLHDLHSAVLFGTSEFPKSRIPCTRDRAGVRRMKLQALLKG